MNSICRMQKFLVCKSPKRLCSQIANSQIRPPFFIIVRGFAYISKQTGVGGSIPTLQKRRLFFFFLIKVLMYQTIQIIVDDKILLQKVDEYKYHKISCFRISDELI